MLARSKRKCIKSKISKTLINNEINHEDFVTIIDEEKNIEKIKRNYSMMNSQRSDAEKINLMEEGEKKWY